jgi:branched-chain amino acid transport system permease protein
MDFLYAIFIDPFVQMVELPDFLLQVLWEGFVAGVLYALIALGFVLIFKASGVFNFAQGIMVVFAGLTLVGLHEKGVPAYLALILTIGVMGLLALAVERFVMRPLVNQPDIILLMSTIGLTYFLIGFGEFIFGGEPKQMIASELGLPTGSTAFEIGDGGLLILQHIDIAAAVIAHHHGRVPGGVLQQDPHRTGAAGRLRTTTRQPFRWASRSTRSGRSSGLPRASWR